MVANPWTDSAIPLQRLVRWVDARSIAGPSSQSQEPVGHTAASQTYISAGSTVRKPQHAAGAKNIEKNMSPAEGAQEHEENFTRFAARQAPPSIQIPQAKRAAHIQQILSEI